MIEPCSISADTIREILELRVRAVEGHAAGVREEDPQAIHDMRVASRRLRAALVEFRDECDAEAWAVLRTHARGVTRGLGRARELDVTLEGLADLESAKLSLPPDALDHLEGELRAMRAEAALDLHRALDAFGGEELGQALTRMVGPLSEEEHCYTERGRDRLVRLHRKLHTFYRKWQMTLLDDDLHALRIRFKKLRYAVEIYSDLYGKKIKPVLKSLRQAQGVLGSWNDSRMLGEHISECAERDPLKFRAELEAFRADLDARTEALRAELERGLEAFFVKATLKRRGRILSTPVRTCRHVREAAKKKV